MNDLDNILNPEIFFASKDKFPRTYYLHVRADLYIIVGSDNNDSDKYFGFMEEVRLSSKSVKPTDKRTVELFSPMDKMAFEMLVSGIMLHKGFI